MINTLKVLMRARCSCITQLAMDFAESFNGYQVQVGGITLFISESSIVEVFKMDIEGERWFKKSKVDKEALNNFLKPDSQNPRWTSSIHINCLDPHWNTIMILIKEYITCEGRYSHIYRFHMRFLFHMVGHNTINLPYFLLRNIGKMFKKVQKYPKSTQTSLEHDSLITSLVYYGLYLNKIDEIIFLIDVVFDLKEEIERKSIDRRKRGSTKLKKNSPIDNKT